MKFDSRISGIPCVIKITNWIPYIAATTIGHPDNCHPSEGGYGDWEVCDRKGKPANWLGSKLTPKDRARIDGEAFDYMSKQEKEYDY